MRASSVDNMSELHPTARLLLDATMDLLETIHMDDITIAAVLEKSGVSHGSMYHHFADLAELVDIAVVERYQTSLDQSVEAVAALLACSDAAEFRRRAEEVLVELHDQGRRPARMTRLEVLGASAQRPGLARRLAVAQRDHLDQQGALFAEFQRRDWMRNDLDAMAMSTFASATFLGRTVDDVSDQPIDPAAWTTTALVALRAVLFDV